MIDITIKERDGNFETLKADNWEIKDNCIILLNKGGLRIAAYPLYWHSVQNVVYEFEKKIKG
mgnify:CR=1 FL=1